MYRKVTTPKAVALAKMGVDIWSDGLFGQWTLVKFPKVVASLPFYVKDSDWHYVETLKVFDEPGMVEFSEFQPALMPAVDIEEIHNLDYDYDEKG